MGTYDRQIATALRLISQKGKAVQIVRQTTTIPNPDTPWVPGNSVETLESADAVFLNFTSDDMATQGKMPGVSEIQASDRKVLIAAAALTSAPTTSDQLRDEQGDWSIEWVQALAPNGQNILYTLRVRK